MFPSRSRTDFKAGLAILSSILCLKASAWNFLCEVWGAGLKNMITQWKNDQRVPQTKFEQNPASAHPKSPTLKSPNSIQPLGKPLGFATLPLSLTNHLLFYTSRSSRILSSDENRRCRQASFATHNLGTL
jgi:hypothetical protein